MPVCTNMTGVMAAILGHRWLYIVLILTIIIAICENIAAEVQESQQWALSMNYSTSDNDTLVYFNQEDGQVTVSTITSNMTSNYTIDNCVMNSLKIKIPLILTCLCLSIVACLSAFLVYVLIAKNIFRAMADNNDNVTKHWIHLNFMMSFLLRDLSYLILIPLTLIARIFELPVDKVEAPANLIGAALFTFALVANFYWMFAEGLALYISVFYPFMDFTQYHWFKIKVCLVGWLTPALLLALWMVTEVIQAEVLEAHNVTHTSSLDYFEWPELTFILIPIYVLLFVNLVMMCRILCKVSHVLHEEQQRIKRRLTKATIALSLLLGIPFIIPAISQDLVSNADPCAGMIYSLFNDVAAYTQGLFVAIFYVLTNEEVLRYTRRHIPIPQTPRISWTSRTPRSSRSSSSRLSGANNNGSIPQLNCNGKHDNHHLDDDTRESRV